MVIQQWESNDMCILVTRFSKAFDPQSQFEKQCYTCENIIIVRQNMKCDSFGSTLNGQNRIITCPILRAEFEWTQETIITSFSRPWKVSTSPTSMASSCGNLYLKEYNRNQYNPQSLSSKQSILNLMLCMPQVQKIS